MWFFNRALYPGTLYLIDADGNASLPTNLTDGALNAGFFSFPPAGDMVRASSVGLELGIARPADPDLRTGDKSSLTQGWYNTPGWSPDGERIIFTRQTNWTAEYGPR